MSSNQPPRCAEKDDLSFESVSAQADAFFGDKSASEQSAPPPSLDELGEQFLRALRGPQPSQGGKA